MTRSKTSSRAEVARILGLANSKGKAEHVREILRPMAETGDTSMLVQPQEATKDVLEATHKKQRPWPHQAGMGMGASGCLMQDVVLVRA